MKEWSRLLFLSLDEFKQKIQQNEFAEWEMSSVMPDPFQLSFNVPVIFSPHRPSPIPQIPFCWIFA